MWVFDECLLWSLIGEVGIDISNICRTCKFGHVGRLDLSHDKLLPIDRFKEGVSLDLINSESIGGVSLKQSSEKRCGLGAETREDLDIMLRDLLENLVARSVTL